VGVAGDQPDSGQAAGDQATKERRPACPVLGAAQLQPSSSRYPSALQAVATSTAVLHTRPPSRTFMLNASTHTNPYGPASSGRLRHASTTSSSSAQIRDTCDLEIPSSPIARATSSTRRVDTPST
jgi:hypothetical protein